MDTDAKKQLLRQIPHAVYVITCQAQGQTVASTVTWATQASFEPPLLAVCLRRDSTTYQAVKNAQAFVLNFLGEGQKDLAQKFFKHVEPEGFTLAEVPFQPSPTLRFPVFPDMAGHLECRVLSVVEKGDHCVVVAEVLEAAKGEGQGVLLLSTTGWQYGG